MIIFKAAKNVTPDNINEPKTFWTKKFDVQETILNLGQFTEQVTCHNWN